MGFFLDLSEGTWQGKGRGRQGAGVGEDMDYLPEPDPGATALCGGPCTQSLHAERFGARPGRDSSAVCDSRAPGPGSPLF